VIVLRVGAGTGGWRLGLGLGLDGEETTGAGWYNVVVQRPPALTGRMRAEDSRSKLKHIWVRTSENRLVFTRVVNLLCVFIFHALMVQKT